MQAVSQVLDSPAGEVLEVALAGVLQHSTPGQGVLAVARSLQYLVDILPPATLRSTLGNTGGWRERLLQYKQDRNDLYMLSSSAACNTVQVLGNLPAILERPLVLQRPQRFSKSITEALVNRMKAVDRPRLTLDEACNELYKTQPTLAPYVQVSVVDVHQQALDGYCCLTCISQQQIQQFINHRPAATACI